MFGSLPVVLDKTGHVPLPQAKTSMSTRVSELNRRLQRLAISSIPGLSPFHKGETTFWTSTNVSDTTKLGYSYPEFNGLDMGNKGAVWTAVGTRIKQLYETPTFRGLWTATDSGKFAPHAPHPDGGLHEWTARIVSKQFELHHSYTVLIFLGEVPDDPSKWPVSPRYVGSHSAFVNTSAQSCDNCLNHVNLIIEGFVDLNRPILRLSGLQSLEPDDVVPYLTENLNWRVLKVKAPSMIMQPRSILILFPA